MLITRYVPVTVNQMTTCLSGSWQCRAMIDYDPWLFFTQAACQSVQASIRDRKSPLSKNARITPYFR